MVAAVPGLAVTAHPTSPLERIRDTRLIAVLRAVEPGEATAVVDALLAAGVTVIEFTADSTAPFETVHEQRERVGDRAAIGLGTVLDVPTARQAVDAGAAFVVTPTANTDVIEMCVDEGVPVIGGAYTPTEARTVAESGADLVKVFPAATGGPAHVRALQGPLGDLPLVPTGGITVETAGDYLSSGAVAVGVGGGLFPDGALEAGRYNEITARVERLMAAVRE